MVIDLEQTYLVVGYRLFKSTEWLRIDDFSSTLLIVMITLGGQKVNGNYTGVVNFDKNCSLKMRLREKHSQNSIAFT